MKQLLYKDMKMCMVPMVPLFYGFALMLLIPSYPYLVAGFFTCNSIFYLFNQATMNKDLLFCALLPVSKRDMVKSRVWLMVLIEGGMLLLVLGMVFVNHLLHPMGNPAGLDGSLTLLGGMLVLFAVFHLTFLPAYYAAPYRVGRHFFISTVSVFAWIILCEGFCILCAVGQGVPLFDWVEGRLDCFPGTGAALRAQLVCLGISGGIYALCTLWASNRAQKALQKACL